MNALALIPASMVGNVEAEAALLGGLMLANKQIDSVADKLVPDDFSDPFFGRLYSAIIKEHSLGHSPNYTTLKPYFDADEQSIIGGLTGSGAQIIGIAGFVQQISELARRRRLIESLTDIIEAARGSEEPVVGLVSCMEAAIADATRQHEGATELSAAKCITAALDAIERQDPGVTCGIEPIDRAMGPVRKKNLAILASRPGMGKSCVAGSYAIGAARNGHGVLFVSLEMSAEEIGERMACDLSFGEISGGVPYEAVVRGKVSQDQMRALMVARDEMEELPIQVVDVGALSIVRLAMIVRRWKRRFAARGQSLDLVIVDYLQKLRVTGLTNRFEVITEISQALKEIAKDNDLGVLALAQLSRKVEERHDKRPQLADLRESGQIEQDADVVLFLLREEYYLQKTEPHPDSAEHLKWLGLMEEARGKIDFICAKRRKGRESITHGHFWGQYQAVRG